MPSVSPTRGYGLLEPFLARQRAKRADRLIPDYYRSGAILDIGCGTFPFFLLNTQFREKVGLDKALTDEHARQLHEHRITVVKHDIESNEPVPLDDESFEVVTMLAVLEHVQPEKLSRLMRETCRILKPNGIFIMTTPVAWSEKLLRFMAKLWLVSPEEIAEHVNAFTKKSVLSLLLEANFRKEKTQAGYFELFANLWVTAVR